MRRAIEKEVSNLNKKLRGLLSKRRTHKDWGKYDGAMWECIWTSQIESYERILSNLEEENKE